MAHPPAPRPPPQAEIEVLFTKLCHKLDALSNFHFTPKAPVVDLAVRANVPAIAMEEVAPVGVSDATLRAPEEVYAKAHGREGVLVVRAGRWAGGGRG